MCEQNQNEVSKQNEDMTEVKEFLLSHDCYTHLHANDQGEIPSYSEYKEFIEQMLEKGGSPLPDLDTTGVGASFVPPGMANVSPVMGKLAYDFISAGTVPTIDEMFTAGAERLRQEIKSKIDQSMRGMGKGQGISGIGKGGDGGTSQEGYSGGTKFNPNGLSLNPKPISSSFRTDIVPYYRPKYYLDGSDDTAPLIIKVLNVFPEYASGIFNGDGTLSEYFNTKAMSDWVASFNTRVRLNSFTGPLVDRKYVINYLTTISYCLAVYYSYASIVSHFLLVRNRNEAMIKLYESLSAEDLNKISILRQVLNNLPLDPRISEFMFHLYGNYKQSFLPGSPLIKFLPFEFQSSTSDSFGDISVGNIERCLALLEAKPFRDFNQLYVQAYPELVGNEVLSYDGKPEEDPNWMSLWVNAPYIGNTQSGGNVRTPTASTSTQSIKLNLLTDAPDGWIDAAGGIYDTSGTGAWRSGFGANKRPYVNTDPDGFFLTSDIESSWVSSSQTYQTTCYIYREDTLSTGGTGKRFFPISRRETSQIASGNTFNVHITAPNVTTFQRFSTENAEPRTMRDSTILCQQFIDFMYTPPSMKPTSTIVQSTQGQEDESQKGGGRRRRRTRK